MCTLKDHNHLSINNGSYSFANFFSTSSLSSFLEIQETCGSSPKLLFVKPNKVSCVVGTNLYPYMITHKKPKYMIGTKSQLYIKL